MAKATAAELTLYSDTYNDEGYSNVDHLMRAQLHETTELAPAVTSLFYSNTQYGSQAFPLLFYTEGSRNRRAIKSIEYTSNVYGKPKKGSVIAATINSGTDKPGLGRTPFVIRFSDRWFMMNQEIYSSNKEVVLRVIDNPVKNGNNYDYTVELVTDSADTYCPVSLLAAGTRWSGGPVKVGIYGSEGTESRSQAPGKVKNQVSLLRDSYNLKGNIQNKIMVVEIKMDGKSMKYWVEFELYQRMLQWKEKCESDLWYSRYNRDENGNIHNFDKNGQAPIPSGAGILQQIPNEDSYSTLTTDKLTQVVRDALYNASDSMNRKIRVHTGIGGMQEADAAMKADYQGWSVVTDKQAGGNTNSSTLTYGSYFTKYKHVDGAEVEFVLNPIQDRGLIAEASEKHPLTGLPMESHNMYFIDYSEYDGKSNIEYIYEEGRGETSWIVAGAMLPPGYENSKIPLRSHDKDESSIHWMKSHGIHIGRPTNCFKLYCTAS